MLMEVGVNARWPVRRTPSLRESATDVNIGHRDIWRQFSRCMRSEMNCLPGTCHPEPKQSMQS